MMSLFEQVARQAGPLVHLQLSSLTQQADCVNWIWAIVKIGSDGLPNVRMTD